MNEAEKSTPCPCCGQPVSRNSLPDDPRQDFEHFLAYSNRAGEPEDLRQELWKAYQAAWQPTRIQVVVIGYQGQPSEGPPTAVDFKDPHGARVELGPWQATEFDRWEIRLPLRPLRQFYRPDDTFIEQVKATAQSTADATRP